MSQINATVTGVRNETLKGDIGNFLVVVISIDKNYTDLRSNSDYFYVGDYNLPYSCNVVAYRDRSAENITPLNINGSVIFKTVKITRTAINSFTYYIDNVAKQTLTLDTKEDKQFIYIKVYETLDGVWLAQYGMPEFGSAAAGITFNNTGLFGLVSMTSDMASYSAVLYPDTKQLGDGLKGAIAPTDPYAGAGDSTTDGGDGTFDGSSDPVPVPSLPSVGATDTGFITLFVPTRAQLKQVAEYMWGGLFDLSTWKRLFEDPMDCILGLSVVPVTVPATASGNITVGNIELSGITLPIADEQYVEVDCGTIDFTHRYFGSYLDYEPYTKMSLFVPYSGVHSVSADDIIGKVVGLKYHIDILTGSLVAFLTCGDSVLYEFNGACASNIPVNSMNYASTIENAIRIAVNIGTTVATAGASAPVQGISQAQQTARNIGTGISLAGSTTEGALSLKPNIDRAGSLGGTTGLMGNQIPYFIITRPRLCKPKNQDFFQGYPSFIQTSVGDLIGKGFTSFTNIIIAESFMTDAENEELESILQGGVYL